MSLVIFISIKDGTVAIVPNTSSDMMMNLHNHTTFSDGRHSPRDIIDAAVNAKLSHIAITDHYGTTKVNSLSNEQLVQYTEEIKALAEEYKDRIKVLIGVEIDASKERTDFVKLYYEHISTLDFVLFEYVQNEIWNGMPLWEALKIRERIKCPMGLAHNNFAKNFAHTDHGDLIGVLEANSVFIELCTNLRYSKFNKPYYNYSEEFFCKLKGTDVLLSIGTDTHSNLKTVGNVKDAVNFVRKLELEDNLITKIF
jgi:DNA polymerase (family 10)